MDKYDIEIIRLLVKDKGGVMERSSWKSICKALGVVQKLTHNRPIMPSGATGVLGDVSCPRCGGRLLYEIKVKPHPHQTA